MRTALRWLAVLAAGLVIVALALAALEAPIRAQTERRVAEALQQEAGLSVRPDVSLEGSPFLWHLFRGDIPVLRVSSAETTASSSGRTLTLQRVDARLGRVLLRPDIVRADTVTGSALLPYESLTPLAGIPLAYGGGDLVRATVSGGAFGVDLDATITGRLVLDEEAQTLRLADPTVAVRGSDLPAGLSRLLLERAAQEIELPRADGVRVASVTPTASGIAVTVTGGPVALRR